jgi:hypothetical protein
MNARPRMPKQINRLVDACRRAGRQDEAQAGRKAKKDRTIH